MELLGDRNWWVPKWLGKVLPELHVEPSTEIGEAGHVVGAPLFPGHRAEEGLGDARTVEPLVNTAAPIGPSAVAARRSNRR